MLKLIRRFFGWADHYRHHLSRSTKSFYSKHQLQVISGTAGILIVSFLAAQFIKTQPETPQAPTLQPKQVKTLTVGQDDLTQSTQATVINHSSLTLVAQSAGPVRSLLKSEGDYVSQGTWIAALETAYNAGNAASISRQIAQKNLTLADESLKNTVTQVVKNRELADKNRDNTEELRRISDESIGQTESIIDLTNQLIDTYQAALDTDPTDTASKVALQSYKSALLQLESGLKNTRYQTDTDNPPAKLADLNKDLVYTTTDLQLKSAQIQKDIAALSLKAAQISEAATRVSAPISGQIDRIYVNVGQYVTPGTPVAKLTGTDNFQILASISSSLATRIDTTSPLTLALEDRQILLHGYHVTGSPTSGQLYQLIATIPSPLNLPLAEGQTVNLSLPLSPVFMEQSTQLVPVDAVFITSTNTFVYLLEEGHVASRDIEIGSIIGDQIEIFSGLLPGDRLILDRSVTQSQPVESITN